MRLPPTISIFHMTHLTQFTMVGVLLGACGDDDGTQDPMDASEEASTSATDPTTTTAPDTLDTSDTTGETTAADTTGGDEAEYAALVRGTLFTDDLAEAQALHDAIAAGGQRGAMALGDFGHDVGLGTDLLGTTPDEFVAIDRWTSLEGAMTLYGDPMYVEAFMMLFAEPVMPELFVRRSDWHEWGDLDAADDVESRVFVVVRGRLAEAPDDAQELHDQLAGGGEEAATMLGDVAHVVWLGVEDPQEYFAVDVWTSGDAIEMFYANEDLQAGFGMLFEAPPVLAVYRSTEWHQW
jgi:heme-degrading monooxygenase HmoA